MSDEMTIPKRDGFEEQTEKILDELLFSDYWYPGDD